MKHKWTYANVGGSTRVVIKNGEDIAHLSDLDEKLWTVLACPSSGLEIADESLRLLDINGDGKIHIKDVVLTADWLTAALDDMDVLLAGSDELALAAIKAGPLRDIAEELAVDGKLRLQDVQTKMAAVAVEQKALADAPYAADVMAAYKACEATYKAYYQTAKLAAIGLAEQDKEAAVPGLTEEAFVQMGEKIAAWEKEKAAVEKANAEALVVGKAKYKDLEKLLLLVRDYCVLLRNFVSFQDFYAVRGLNLIGRAAEGESPLAIFQAGTLVIDQRACHLCMKVSDMTKHQAQAADSGMYLLYCQCTLPETGEKMQIVAAMTVGDIRNLKVGKNALFYDRQGRDWEAEVVKIVDNPISIGQAFWSPYKKLGDWVSGLISKSAAEKEQKSFADLTAKLQTGKVDNKDKAPVPFDMARFAGIFAAIGLAIGSLGTFLTNLWSEMVEMKAWSLLIVPTILLLVSGPSMVLAWMKLRKRNLAPLLNANGWAVNADAIVSVLFGQTLTEQAVYPVVRGSKATRRKGEKDMRRKTIGWWIALIVTLVAAAAVAGYCLWKVKAGN